MTFTVRSNSFSDGDYLANAHILSADFGFGCQGNNQSPHLAWSGAPAETKSFAVTCYDPDAPTGSGFWHWVVLNVPATTTSIEHGAKTVPGTAVANDFGTAEFDGPCPPPGKPHHYIFTVHALKTDKLDVPPT